MNSSGSAEFVEFWSFLRRRGIAGKDIYHSDNCPSCGAPQKPMLDIGKCEYCNTLLNSGEYDWVLSEITQSDDYTGSSPKVEKARNLSEKVRGLIDENKDVAVQLLEHIHEVVVLRRHKQLLAVASHEHAADTYVVSDVDADVAGRLVGIFRRPVGKQLLHGC